MPQSQCPLFRYERHPDEDLGRRLIASKNILKDRLLFVERPVVAMQSMGNMHTGALVCSYCMAFCGSPEQALRVTADPSCLVEIATNNITSCTENDDDDGGGYIDDPHALYCCRHKCGHIYCSLECQQDDWEWGGHKELCTGEIPDPDEADTSQEEETNYASIVTNNEGVIEDKDLPSTESVCKQSPSLDPLLQFKVHARETNEIFLLVATWLVRILKHGIPYHDDDNMNTHPYTDFQMNPWWDVKSKEEQMMKSGQKDGDDIKGEEDGDDGEPLEKVLKRLCHESHSYLSQTLIARMPWIEFSPWLTPVGMARLIGSLEQNCLGVQRKHALQHDIMQDSDLRLEYHSELIQCLEGAGVIGDDNELSDDDASKALEDDESSAEADDNTVVESNEDEELEYSPDDIATFFANLTQDLMYGSMYDEWDEVIQPLTGISHFSIVPKMNHSCDPNVIVVYKTRGWGRDHPLCAYVVALKDISPGDELTISYIDAEDNYEERQTALANYGFVCTCKKCQREKEELAEGKKSSRGTTESPDEEDLFGEDDEEEDDLFGNDAGEEEDDDDDEKLGQGSDDDDDDEQQLDGAEKLLNLAERLDSILNKSSHAAIPLAYLAPASNYVIKQMSTLIHDIQNTEEFEDDERVIENLLEQNKTGVSDRDFAACRIVGSDLELYLYNILECNGAWSTPMHRASYWCAAISASIGYANEGSFLVSMKYLDKAIILGQDRGAIEDFFRYVELHASQMAAAPCPIAVKCTVPDHSCPSLKELVISTGLSKPIQCPVKEFSSDEKSEKANLMTCYDQSESCVFRGLASRWPAVEKWRKMDSLAREFGHRLVPIEIGSMTTGMKESVFTFRSFVAKYLSASAKKDCWSLEDATVDKKNIAYLAQHPLLDQIPALRNDLNMSPCGVKPTNVNIWMGTGGTRTPLHFDSYDNLLVQLVGAKYVRLYTKEYSPQLYVRKDTSYGSQGNMSELDCELEDFEKHPLAKDCEYTEVLLLPGDCLFIPARQWHYVRSLSTSVSVNYWF